MCLGWGWWSYGWVSTEEREEKSMEWGVARGVRVARGGNERGCTVRGGLWYWGGSWVYITSLVSGC